MMNISIPNFPIEKAFHIRQTMDRIAENKVKLEAMRAELAKRQVRVDIEHVMVGEEEVLLISAVGKNDGVAVSLADIESGAISLQDAVEAAVGE